MKDIFFAMTGSVKRNSRAIKQLRSLSAAGFRVQVLDLFAGNDLPFPVIENVKFRSLDIKGSGPSFFREVTNRFRKVAAECEVDAFHASDLYVLSALAKAAKRHSAKLVYDSRELYPFVASTKEKPWSSLYWRYHESKYIKHCDLVFTVSDSIANAIESSYDIARPLVIYNIPEAQEWEEGDKLRKEIGLDPDCKVVLHQGRIAKSRGCTNLAEAFLSIEDAHCIFLGGGPEKTNLESRVEAWNLSERIHFMDPVPNHELLSYTKDANIGVSLLEDTCLNHRFALPNKLFEYINAGVPVMVSDLPEMAKLVTDFELGRIVDSSSPIEIARVIKEMLSNGSELERVADNSDEFKKVMNWEISARKFTEAYASLFSVRPE